MLKITAEEIHFIIYQYLNESGFEHSSFVFAQEANMHENRFNDYRIPSGMLVVFLEKALTLIHMETHLDDSEDISMCRQPYTLLTPHTCDVSVEQTSRTVQAAERGNMLIDEQSQQFGSAAGGSQVPLEKQQIIDDSRQQQDFRQMMPPANAKQLAMPPQQQMHDARYPNPQMQMLEMQNWQQQQLMSQYMNQYVPANQPMLDQMAQYQKMNPMQGQYMMQPNQFQQMQAQQPSAFEQLEHNPGKGIYFLQAEGDNLEISSAYFNPKQRLLVAGGNYLLATMWDLRQEPSPQYGEIQNSLPHVKRHTDTESLELQADVSSVHWSQDGTRLVTSSNDMMARIWRFEEESGQFEIEMVKTFSVMLMISKFNKINSSDQKQSPQLVATGGHSGVITIWTADAKSASNKDVAKLQHEELDPQLVGLELDWQNSRTLAVTGHSKNIYLWCVDTPSRPIQIWSGGHTQEIEQIKWDPTGKLLASCSTDNRVCIWRTESKQPAHVFDELSDRVNLVQWSNSSSTSDSSCPILLAAGCQNGQIAIWNANERSLVVKFTAHQQDGGVKCLAFSPNNKMIASGGQHLLCVWQVEQQSVSLLREFQKPPTFSLSSKMSGGVGTTMTANAGAQPCFDFEFSQVSWSHDQLLLAASIQNRIIIFDVRKLQPQGVAAATSGPQKTQPH